MYFEIADQENVLGWYLIGAAFRVADFVAIMCRFNTFSWSPLI